MRWRYRSVWVRGHPAGVSCGLEPWVKMSWFRLDGSCYLVTLWGTRQLWPPAPVIIGGRLRVR